MNKMAAESALSVFFCTIRSFSLKKELGFKKKSYLCKRSYETNFIIIKK